MARAVSRRGRRLRRRRPTVVRGPGSRGCAERRRRRARPGRPRRPDRRGARGGPGGGGAQPLGDDLRPDPEPGRRGPGRRPHPDGRPRQATGGRELASVVPDGQRIRVLGGSVLVGDEVVAEGRELTGDEVADPARLGPRWAWPRSSQTLSPDSGGVHPARAGPAPRTATAYPGCAPGSGHAGRRGRSRSRAPRPSPRRCRYAAGAGSARPRRRASTRATVGRPPAERPGCGARRRRHPASGRDAGRRAPSGSTGSAYAPVVLQTGARSPARRRPAPRRRRREPPRSSASGPRGSIESSLDGSPRRPRQCLRRPAQGRTSPGRRDRGAAALLRPARARHAYLVLLIGLIAVAAAIATTDVGHQWAIDLGHQLQQLRRRLRGRLS